MAVSLLSNECLFFFLVSCFILNGPSVSNTRSQSANKCICCRKAVMIKEMQLQGDANNWIRVSIIVSFGGMRCEYLFVSLCLIGDLSNSSGLFYCSYRC